MTPTSHKLTGWSLPKIGLGTAAWAPPFPPVPQDQVLNQIQFIVSKGSAFFDTSPLYGLTMSERWLGLALENVPRDQFRISSKAGYVIPPEGLGPGKYPKTEWSRENMFASVEYTLKRLKIDCIDIIHLHDPDCCPQDALNIAFPALAELREQGVIRAVGAGMNQWQMLSDFARAADFDCFLLAGRYTLLEQESLPLLELCREKGIALFLGGVFNTGILATGAQPGARYNYRPAPERIQNRVRKMEAVCARHGVPLRAAALQFPLAHPAVRTLVIGSQSKEEFADTLEAVEMPIPADFWAELRSEGLLAPDAPVPGELEITG